jgi:hypothetical protein
MTMAKGRQAAARKHAAHGSARSASAGTGPAPRSANGATPVSETQAEAASPSATAPLAQFAEAAARSMPEQIAQAWAEPLRAMSQASWPTAGLAKDAWDYWVDAWQRSVLYLDVMRRRGNQYHEHMAEKAPHVLSFKGELVADGRKLERPVNYGLVRIDRLEDVPVDPKKRPFVVVDPRAGHGPGIGGFKADSEIGVALRAGHPCYFVGFLPKPVPGQTVEDVMRAEAHFLKMVAELHPEAEGKPVVRSRRGRASRQRCQHVRHDRGAEHRQHDGLHRARRPAHGHALRRARPGRGAPPDPPPMAWTRTPSSACCITTAG